MYFKKSFITGSIPISVTPKQIAFRNGFAPAKIFNANSLTALFISVVLCSRARPLCISLGKVVLDTAPPSDFLRFPQSTERLVGWGGLASMVASSIPKSPIHQGNRIASLVDPAGEMTSIG